MAHADLYYREIINNGKEACSGKNSKNTELTIRFIGAVYDHVFVSKHVPSDGCRTFGKTENMVTHSDVNNFYITVEDRDGVTHTDGEQITAPAANNNF